MTFQLAGPFPHENGDCPYLPGLQWSADYLASKGDIATAPLETLPLQASTFDDPSATLAQAVPSASAPGPDSPWPEGLDDLDVFDRLLASGFRRNGRLFYRTTCATCAECVSLRVDVARFAPTGDQRRALKKNRDVTVEIGMPAYTVEKRDLYQRFVAARYPKAKEDDLTAEAYGWFFVDHIGNTREMRYRIDGRLVGVGLVDLTRDALSSVYFYFDPDLGSRSLGTYSALREIDLCRQTRRRWVYLGFRIAGCKAMRYKSLYRPHQLLVPGVGWRDEDEAEALLRP